MVFLQLSTSFVHSVQYLNYRQIICFNLKAIPRDTTHRMNKRKRERIWCPWTTFIYWIIDYIKQINSFANNFVGCRGASFWVIDSFYLCIASKMYIYCAQVFIHSKKIEIIQRAEKKLWRIDSFILFFGILKTFFIFIYFSLLIYQHQFEESVEKKSIQTESVQ